MAAFRLTWLVPMQKQPMEISLLAAASTFSVTWVRERMPRKWASLIFSIRASSSSAPRRYSILV
jgi:hypothetical protein